MLLIFVVYVLLKPFSLPLFSLTINKMLDPKKLTEIMRYRCLLFLLSLIVSVYSLKHSFILRYVILYINEKLLGSCYMFLYLCNENHDVFVSSRFLMPLEYVRGDICCCLQTVHAFQ